MQHLFKIGRFSTKPRPFNNVDVGNNVFDLDILMTFGNIFLNVPICECLYHCNISPTRSLQDVRVIFGSNIFVRLELSQSDHVVNQSGALIHT